MSEHTIVAAGQFSVTLIHPLWEDGTPTTIDGFRLEGQMLQAQQAMDSSKIIALANGAKKNRVRQAIHPIKRLYRRHFFIADFIEPFVP